MFMKYGRRLEFEPACTALVKEVINTQEEAGSLKVDTRHIMLVADLMTSKGSTNKLVNTVLQELKTSVLARGAFKITVPTIARASLEGQVETLRGVTESVIVGATCQSGPEWYIYI